VERLLDALAASCPLAEVGVSTDAGQDQRWIEEVVRALRRAPGAADAADAADAAVLPSVPKVGAVLDGMLTLLRARRLT